MTAASSGGTESQPHRVILTYSNAAIGSRLPWSAKMTCWTCWLSHSPLTNGSTFQLLRPLHCVRVACEPPDGKRMVLARGRLQDVFSNDAVIFCGEHAAMLKAVRASYLVRGRPKASQRTRAVRATDGMIRPRRCQRLQVSEHICI